MEFNYCCLYFIYIHFQENKANLFFYNIYKNDTEMNRIRTKKTSKHENNPEAIKENTA